MRHSHHLGYYLLPSIHLSLCPGQEIKDTFGSDLEAVAGGKREDWLKHPFK